MVLQGFRGFWLEGSGFRAEGLVRLRVGRFVVSVSAS